MKTSRLIALVIVVTLVVEGMLLLRLWIQSTDRPMDSDGVESLFETTDSLAAPAVLITGDEPLQDPGVIDYTILVALEMYLAGALVVIVAIALLNGGWSRMRALRPVHYPDFVLEQMKGSRTRRVWQPVLGSGKSTSRHYVVHVTRRGQTPIRKLPFHSR